MDASLVPRLLPMPAFWHGEEPGYEANGWWGEVKTLQTNFIYRIAGIFRGGVIFAFFAVEWDPRKINPRKFMTRIHVCVVLQTVLSMKHVTATIAIPRKQLPNSKGPLSFLV